MILPPSPISVAPFVTLASAMAAKHFFADFVLQTSWMARAKEHRVGWIAPLGAHAMCHAGLTLLIIMLVAPSLWWLAAFDLFVHFAVDRTKTLLNAHCQWTPQQARYWWLFGFDQMLHQLTNIVVIAALLAQ